jgi:K+-transporting ATPase ATPase B chain
MSANWPTHVRLVDAPEPGQEGPIDKLAFEIALTASLKHGDLVLCVAGDIVPAGGVVVEGVATIEDARAPHSTDECPVFTGRGLLVRPGTRLRSGYVVLRVIADH